MSSVSILLVVFVFDFLHSCMFTISPHTRIHTHTQCVEFQQLNYPTFPDVYLVQFCPFSPLPLQFHVLCYSLGNMIMMLPSYFDLTPLDLPFLEPEIHSCFSSARFSMVDPVLLPLFFSSSLSFLSSS